MTPSDVLSFRTFGFLVLRDVLQAEALREELDHALGEGVAAPIATASASVQYVPMMCTRTPTSLQLLDRFQSCAAHLLGAPMIPLRAKGMRYFGSTDWHRDSALELPSVGFAAYLEPLREDSGALRVLPGSHRRQFGDMVGGYLETAVDRSVPGIALPTEPGDVIVFDERLFHASLGGVTRRQWRVDYFLAPRSPAEESSARQYVGTVFPPDWDGGYDVDRFPSYGPDWQLSGRAAVEQLRELGVYELARAQESHMRSQRAASAPK